PLRIIASDTIGRVDLSERAAPTEKPRSYCPISKLHCAPPPAFCMISLGSIVQRKLGDAFDARACGSLGGNAGGCHRRADFVGFAPGQRAFARSEVELAAARSDIDIADAADHGLRIDGNFRVGGEAESSVAAKQARDDPLV